MNPQWQERIAILRTKPFLIGLVLRLCLLFIGGSSLFQNLFIPFLDHFAQNPFSNPWNSFAPEYFPYGLFPLILLGGPKILAYQIWGELSLGINAFNFFLLKFPLLLFDVILFWALSRFTRINNHRLTWFYWLNPVVIYINFVLGHFDVISMGLIVLCLFFIGKQHWISAGILAGLALISKFQVAIMLPFIAAYIWNNHYRIKALKHIGVFFLMASVTTLIGFLPLYEAKHLIYSTFSSPETQRLFAAKLNMGANIDFILGIALMTLALGRLVFSTRINFSGLLFGSGFLLGCLVFVTNAHPGWYLWFIPFLALFFANYVTAPSLIFILTLLVYFIHFVLFLPLNTPFAAISFTLLQTGILVQLLMLYWLNLRHEAQLKNRLRPLMLGLSGDSGAGKNYFCQIVQALLNPNNCFVIEGDNYHKWERGDENWELLTHLNPNSNHLLKMQDHANKIVRGQPIVHHQYDHQTGRFMDAPPTNPAKAIIFQGLHSLYLKSLRDILDLKIFLDPHEKVRTVWKIQRDVHERGHSLEKVLNSIEKRKTDSALHIQPQKTKSDWTIEITTDETFDPLSFNQKKEDLPLYLKYTLLNDEPITELLEELQKSGLKTTLNFLSTDLDKVVITIRGQISQEHVHQIAESLFPHLRHITRSATPPQFYGGFEGVHQLFLLALLSKRLEGKS